MMVVLSHTTAKRQIFLVTFVSICTPINNSSVLPSLLCKTNTRINYFRITNKDRLSIIKSSDSSKSHGYDNISIKMIKFCSGSVTISLKIIFEESLKKGIFPEIWKKANVVPIHKKRQNFNKKLPPY